MALFSTHSCDSQQDNPGSLFSLQKLGSWERTSSVSPLISPNESSQDLLLPIRLLLSPVLRAPVYPLISLPSLLKDLGTQSSEAPSAHNNWVLPSTPPLLLGSPYDLLETLQSMHTPEISRDLPPASSLSDKWHPCFFIHQVQSDLQPFPPPIKPSQPHNPHPVLPSWAL